MAKDKRKLSIKMALEWAFMTEYAQLDLDDGKPEFRAGIGTEYVLMQRMQLGGVKIDGGGRSAPHIDADIIAAGLTQLALVRERRGLALFVAECARVGSSPDWMPGAQPKIEPAEWMPKRGFAMEPRAKEQVIRRYYRNVYTPHPRNPEHQIRRRVKVEESFCPCIWNPSLQEIESARLTYMQWVDALEWLRDSLRSAGDLETIELTDILPVYQPWEASNPLAETPPETKSAR